MGNPEVCFTVHIVSVDSLIVSCILRSYLVLPGSACGFSAFHPDFYSQDTSIEMMIESCYLFKRSSSYQFQISSENLFFIFSRSLLR